MKKLFVIMAVIGAFAISSFTTNEAHRMPPACPSNAVDQYVVTNDDGSATAYCVYPIASGYVPVATYSLACDYCVWQAYQPN